MTKISYISVFYILTANKDKNLSETFDLHVIQYIKEVIKLYNSYLPILTKLISDRVEDTT